MIPINYLNEAPHMDHEIIGSILRLNPGTPFLFMIGLTFLGTISLFVGQKYTDFYGGGTRLHELKR